MRVVRIRPGEEPDVATVAAIVERAYEGYFAEEEARSRGVGELRLFFFFNDTATTEIYTRLGYTEVERRSDNGFERVFYSKRLPRPS